MAQVPSNLIPTRITQLQDAPVASEDGLLLYVYEGNTYKIRAGDLVSVSGVPTSRQVIAGTSLQGGGALTADVTLSVAPAGVSDTELSSTGVTPGVYGDESTVPTLTVNAQGRVEVAAETPVKASMANVSGILDTTHGGTGKNITPSAGSLVYSDATNLQLSEVGLSGQVLVSGGSGAPTWGSALIVSNQPAGYVYAGPVSGGSAPTAFRPLANEDLPVTGVAAGTYGSSTKTPQVTVNEEGVVTAATDITVTPAFSSITAKPTSLAGYGINDAQPLDATLTAFAGLVNGANKLAYFTNSDIMAVTDFTAFARTLLDDSDAATARATLGAAGTVAELGDVTLTSLVAGNLLQYDNSISKWVNVAPTTLAVSSAVSLANTRTIGGSNFNGTVNVTSFPSPGPIGETSPDTGNFTTLTATLISGGTF
jgi:hypothetical protein